MDPKPNVSISNYAAFANNPIWFQDPLGDTLNIKGSNEFTSNTQKNLMTIYQTEQGKVIIDRLMSSSNNYSIDETFFVTSSQYDNNTETISYDDNPWRNKLEGGVINGVLALAHELTHAFQYADNMRGYSMTEDAKEIEAVYFQNYLASVFGYGKMRSSRGNLSFPTDEQSYNPKNEKITDFQIAKNKIATPASKTFTDNRSDGTVTKIPFRPQDPGYTVTYVKSYTVDGKIIPQSIKKTNETKLAKEQKE